MNTFMIYVTVDTPEEAVEIAETVIREKLAACANIIDQATSLYEWKGALCRETESVLILKTSDQMKERLIERIKQLHSYEIPCITALQIDGGNPDFLQWIVEETSSPIT